MNNAWWYVLAAIIVGSILKYLFLNPWAAVVIDVGVFAAVYLILRRYPLIDLRRSMIFFGCLTVVNILVDVGILNGMIGNIVLLALLAWMMFGQGGGQGGGRGGRRQPRLRHPWHK